MAFKFLEKWLSKTGGSPVSGGETPTAPQPQVFSVELHQDWRLVADPGKNLRQVVLEINQPSWWDSRFATLMLAGKYGPLIMNDWITGWFRLDSQPGPFLLIRADGFVEQVKSGKMSVGFSFFRMPSGGVFAIHAEPQPRPAGSPHPFMECVYGLDVEDNRQRIEDAFAKETLEIVLADRSDSSTKIMETGQDFANPQAKFDLSTPLSAALRETLMREWDDLLSYHASLPAENKDYNRSAQEMWALLPLEQSPLLPSQHDNGDGASQKQPPAPTLAVTASSSNTLVAAANQADGNGWFHPENTNLKSLADFFEDAFYEVAKPADADFFVVNDDNYKVSVRADKKGRWAKFSLLFGRDMSTNELAQLRAINEINREYIMFRTYYWEDNVNIDYYLWTEGGVTKKDLMLAYKLFRGASEDIVSTLIERKVIE